MEALELVKYSGSREIFEILSRFPKRRFTINELAGEAGVPFASAWRLVKKWELAGLIETGRVGRSVTVNLRRSEYVDLIASLLKKSTTPQAFTVSRLRNLLKVTEIKEAYLFGSVAKGEETLVSDIDLVLLAEPGFNANNLVFTVYEKYGTKLVPLVFSSKRELELFMVGKKGERLK